MPLGFEERVTSQTRWLRRRFGVPAMCPSNSPMATSVWRDAQLQQMSMYLPAGVLPWIWHPYFSYQAVSYQQVPAFAGCADASVKDPAARARARSALLIRMIPAAKTNYIISPYYSRCLCGL